MPDDKIKQMYDYILSTGKMTDRDLGDYRTFTQYLTDSNATQTLYNNLIKNNVLTQDQAGNFNGFYQYVKSNLPNVQTGKQAEPLFSQTYDFNKSLADIDARISNIDREIAANDAIDSRGSWQETIGDPAGVIGMTRKAMGITIPDAPKGYRPEEHATSTLQNSRMYLQDAKDLIKLAQRGSIPKSAYEEIGKSGAPFMPLPAEIWRGLGNTLVKDFASMGLTELLREESLVEVKDKYIKDPNSLTPDEERILMAEGVLQAIKNEDKSLPFMVANGVREMIPYMVQFAMTGGTNVAVRGGLNMMMKSTAPLAGKGLLKYFTGLGAKKALAYTAGSAVQAAVMPMTYTNALERNIGEITPEGQVKTYDAVPKALLKGYGDAFVEVFTENLGGYLTAKNLFKNTAEKIAAEAPARSLTLAEKIRKGTAFNQPLQEWGEELAAWVMQPVVVEQELPHWNWKEQATIFLTVAAMSGGFYVAETGNKKYSEVNARRKYLGDIPDDVRAQVINTVRPGTSAQQMAAELEKIGKSGKISQQQFSSVLQYAANRAARSTEDEYRKVSERELGALDIENNIRSEIGQFTYKDGETLYQAVDNGGRVFWVKDGDLTVDPQSKEWKVGTRPLVVVPLEGGQPVPMAATDLNSVRAGTMTDYIKQAVDTHRAQYEVAQTIQGIQDDAEIEQMDAATPNLKAGDVIEYMGRSAEVNSVSPEGVEITFTDNEQPGIVSPQDFGSIKRIEMQTVPEEMQPTAQNEQQTAPEAPKGRTLTANVGKKEIKVQFNAQPDGTFISDNTFAKESDAKKVVAALGDQYGKLDFQYTDTNTDPFEKSNFVITVKQKAESGQNQEETVLIAEQSTVPITESGQPEISQTPTDELQPDEEQAITPDNTEVVLQPETVEPVAGIPEEDIPATPEIDQTPEAVAPAQPESVMKSTEKPVSETPQKSGEKESKTKSKWIDEVRKRNLGFLVDDIIEIEEVSDVDFGNSKSGAEYNAEKNKIRHKVKSKINTIIHELIHHNLKFKIKPEQLDRLRAKARGLMARIEEVASGRGLSGRMLDFIDGYRGLATSPEQEFVTWYLTDREFNNDLDKLPQTIKTAIESFVREVSGFSETEIQKIRSVALGGMGGKVVEQKQQDATLTKELVDSELKKWDRAWVEETKNAPNSERSLRQQPEKLTEKSGDNIKSGNIPAKQEQELPETTPYNSFTRELGLTEDFDAIPGQAKTGNIEGADVVVAQDTEKGKPAASGNKVILESIRVPEENRRQGIARKAMEKIVAAADKHGITITLRAHPEDGSGLKSQNLRDFYRTMGFSFIGSDGIRFPGGQDEPFGDYKDTPEPVVDLGEKPNITPEKAKTLRYKDRVKLTMESTGTKREDWVGVPITSWSITDSPGGTPVRMPNFKFPENYKEVTTPFTNEDSCSLCGAEIKNIYWLQNDKTKQIMPCGSECFAASGEGMSGKQYERQQKISIANQLNDDLIAFAKFIKDTFSTKRTETNWRGFKSTKTEWSSNIFKGADGNIVQTKGQYGDKDLTGRDIYDEINVYTYYAGEPQDKIDKDLLSWYSRKSDGQSGLLVKYIDLLRINNTKIPTEIQDIYDRLNNQPVSVANQPKKSQTPSDEFVGDAVTKPTKPDKEAKVPKVKNLDKKKRAMPARWAKLLEREPESFEETVLQYLLGGGRFRTDDFIRYTGFGDKEAAARRRKATKGRDELRDARLHFLRADGAKMDTFGDSHNLFGMEERGAMDVINGITDIILSHSSRHSVANRLEELQGTGRGEFREEDYVDPELLAQAELDAELEPLAAQIESEIPESLKWLVNEYKLNPNDVNSIADIVTFVNEHQDEFTPLSFPYSTEDLEEILSYLENERENPTRLRQRLSEATGIALDSETEAEGRSDQPTARQREIDRIKADYEKQISDLKETLVSDAQLRNRQADAIKAANKKINLFGQEGDQGEQDMFAGQDAFSTNTTEIRKNIADQVAAYNRKVNEMVDQLEKDMQAEIKLAEGQEEIRFQLQEDELFYQSDGKLYFNPDKITNAQWDKINTYLTRAGFSTRTTQEWKDYFLNEERVPNHELRNDEHIRAFEKVFGTVTEQISHPTDIEKKVITAAKRKFGTTNDFKIAGYVTPDGSMLDFSGRRWGNLDYERGMDHREIQEVMPDDIGGTEAMIQFMNMGNIRIQSYGFEITQIPTSEQKATLTRFIGRLNGDVVIDFMRNDGHVEHSVEYTGASAAKVFADINRFYKDGINPISSPNIRFQLQPGEDMFYSNSIRALDAIKQDKATPEQWKAMLLKNGAKEAELEWFGWNDFVQGKRSFTKTELSDWMNANRVRLEEVELGGTQWDGNVLMSDGEQVANLIENEDGTWSFESDFSDGSETYNSRQEAMDEAFQATIGDPYAAHGTKYHDYQTPGGSDYKELLITMPVQRPDISQIKITSDDTNWTVKLPEQDAITFPLSKADDKYEAYDYATSGNAFQSEPFRSSHFDQPNIVVHVRFNSRVDANGDNVLFIEEIQSDWAEKGRKEGFVDNIPAWDQETGKMAIDAIKSLDNLGFTSWQQAAGAIMRDSNWETSFPVPDDKKDIIRKWRTNAVAQDKIKNAVPNMPFRNTQQWVGLALKRMVRYAAENGYDRIAWTTGEQQAERYDLSKQISKIQYWRRENPEDKEPIYGIYAWDLQGTQVLSNSTAKENDLEGIVGKEIAKKIIDTSTWYPKNLTGLDLKVGGEGMKAFYDNIIPNTANKLFGKYGAKVNIIKVQTEKEADFGGTLYRVIEDDNMWLLQSKDEGGEWNPVNYFDKKEDAERFRDKYNKQLGGTATVQSLPITPELGEAAMSAQPMFKVVENPMLSKDTEFAGDMIFGQKYKDFLGFHSTLQQMADDFATKTGTRIIVVKSSAELPKPIFDSVIRKNKQGHRVPALFYDRRDGQPSEVYLISNQTTSTEEAARSLLHEVVSHRGLRNLLGAKYDNLLRQVWAQMSEADKRKFAGLYRSADRLLIADEWLAKQAETFGDKSPSWLQKVFSQIRQWIRDTFGKNLKFTDGDLRSLFAASRKAMAQQRKAEVKQDEFAGDIFSQPKTIRQQIIGETGAERLQNALMSVSTIGNLTTAKDMLAKGKTPKEIRIATGWEVGADGKWRGELNDQKTVLLKSLDDIEKLVDKNTNFTPFMPLHEVIDNKELFTAYPKLYDSSHIRFFPIPTGDSGSVKNAGRVDIRAGDVGLPGKAEITIAYQRPGSGLVQRFMSAQRAGNESTIPYSEDTIKSVIIHEVQHLIQRLEGFAPGGNLDTVWDILVRSYKGVLDTLPETRSLDEAGKIRIAEERIVRDGNYLSRDDARQKLYERLAGEIEAVNVQDRMEYTDDRRKSELLQDSARNVLENYIILPQKNEPQFQIIGEQGAQRLVEAGLAVDSINNLSIAKEMETAGKSEKEIWLATGWQKGKEGKWRMEVPDFTTKIKTNGWGKLNAVMDLDEVIDAPELFKAYPNLKNTMVFIDIKPENYDDHGSFVPGKKAVYVNNKGEIADAPAEIKVFVRRENTFRSVLIHEIQHAIQHEEGFAKGGNLQTGADKYQEWKYLQIDNKKKRMDEITKELLKPNLNPKTVDLLDNEYSLLEKDIADLRNNVPSTFRAYQSIAGETEARNAQTRLTYGDLKRAETMLSESEDVAREDQIVLMESVQSALDLTPEVPQTETEAFKKWFGSSKVVDENGKPLVVYHGTVNDFDEFKHSYGVPGYFFSNMPEESDKWANFDEGSVIPVYLSIQNPFVVDYKNRLFDFERTFLQVIRSKINEHDGVIIRNIRNFPESKPSVSYVVFNPAQIKSATGNIGAFDATNPDIRFSLQPDEELPEDKAEFVNYINDKFGWKYQISGNGRIYQEFMGDKMYVTEDDLRTRVANMKTESIVRENNRMVTQYLKDNGFSLVGSNREVGSVYYQKPGVGIVRVSDHKQLSDKYPAPTINAYSEQPGGYEELIQHIKELEDGEVRFTLQPPPADIAQPIDTPPMGSKPMLNQTGDFARELLQDKMLTVRRLQEEILRRGGTVNELSDPYREENLSQSRSKVEMDNYEEKLFAPVLDVVDEITRVTGLSYSDITKYLKAKHAPERNRVVGEGKRVAAGSIDGNLLTDATAQWYIDQFESQVERYDPDLTNKLNRAIQKSTRFTLDRWLNDGRISRAEYDQMIADYEFYVPLRGWDGEKADEIFDYTEGDSGNAFSGFIKAKGRESEADDPLPYILSMARSAIVWGNKNNVKRQMLNLISLNKDMTDLFGFNKMYIVTNADGDVVSESTERPDKDTLPEGWKISTKISDPHRQRRPQYEAKQHEVEVWQNGERIIMNFPGDPKIAAALNGTNIWRPEVTQFLQGTTGRINRFLSSVLTSKNPAFIPINWIRDVSYASMSQMIQKDGSAGEFMKNIPIAAKAIHRHLSGKADTNQNEMDKIYAEFRSMGGETGYVHLQDLEQVRTDIQRELARLSGTQTRMDKVATNAVVRTAGKAMNYLAVESENMSRFATYLTSLSQGKSKKQAAADAKNITVNFNRKGRLSGTLSSLYVFFNANVQGLQNFGKLAKDNKKAFAKAAAAWIAFGALSAELTRLLSPPDDDGENAYDNMSDFLRRNYLVLPNPAWLFGKGERNFITIPLPHGFRSAFALGVIGSDMIHGKVKPLRGVVEAALNTLDSFSPMNFNMNQVIEKGVSIQTVTRPFVPSAAVPIVDVLLNEDFAGNAIYREGFTKDMEKWQPKSEMGMPYVNDLFYEAAAGWTRLLGGDEFRSARWVVDKDGKTIEESAIRGALEFNPSIVEHLIEGYTGGVGTEINNTIKLIADAIQKASGDPEAEIYTRNVPVLRRLYRTANAGDPWKDYSEIKNHLRTYNHFVSKYKNEGDMENFKKLYGNREMLVLDKMVKATEKRIDAVQQRIEREKDKELIRGYYDDIDSIIKDFLDKAKQIQKEE